MTKLSNFKAVILAAGLGTRMKSEVLPKVMQPVGSRAMLEKVISSLKKAGIDEIITVVGHRSDILRKKFDGETLFVEQKQLLGSMDALKTALTKLANFKGNILVACGDSPLIKSETFGKLARKHVAEKAACSILTAVKSDPSFYGRIVRDDKGSVLGIVEEKDASDEIKAVKEINSGTYCFNMDELREHVHAVRMNEKKKEFYLTDVVGVMVSEGRRVVTESCGEEEAIGVNSRKELAEVNSLMNKRVTDKLMASGVTIIDPATTYIDDDAVIGADTIIFPCTVIEKDVVIERGVEIGPFARIRPGTRIAEGAQIGNYAELVRTSIGRNTKMKHCSYLGDAIVGSDVNIGAGAITANYDGKAKYKTVIKDGAFIGVGAILIAPVTIGKKSVVGAGAVVTKNENVPDGATVAGIPARILGTKNKKAAKSKKISGRKTKRG